MTCATSLDCLTPRQREVALLIGAGVQSKEVACKLNLSVSTIEAHKCAVYERLGVHSGIELVHLLYQLGEFKVIAIDD